MMKRIYILSLLFLFASYASGQFVGKDDLSKSLYYMQKQEIDSAKKYIDLAIANPELNTQSSSYQINQSLIAIGSGGIWGRGLGQSTTKLYYLPQPIDDSIFAVIAEELGFIGSILLISIFVILVIRSFLLSRKLTDEFGQLLMIGFGSLIGVQAFVHIASISGLIPLTGVPLPYISYGGTALAIFMTISGIMVNISKYT